jgi:hypothetical protein
MSKRPLTRKWTTAELDRLDSLITSGATAMQAAAALNRKMASVQKKARSLGKTLPGIQKVRAGLRASNKLGSA